MSEFANVMRCEIARTGNYGNDWYDDEEEYEIDDGDLIDMEYERDVDMMLEAKYGDE